MCIFSRGIVEQRFDGVRACAFSNSCCVSVSPMYWLASRVRVFVYACFTYTHNWIWYGNRWRFFRILFHRRHTQTHIHSPSETTTYRTAYDINWYEAEAANKKSILRDKFPLWLCVVSYVTYVSIRSMLYIIPYFIPFIRAICTDCIDIDRVRYMSYPIVRYSSRFKHVNCRQHTYARAAAAGARSSRTVTHICR